MDTSFNTTKEFAEALDKADVLHHVRDRFYIQPNEIYMDGNSLGLASKDAEASLLNALEDWKKKVSKFGILKTANIIIILSTLLQTWLH